MNNLRNNIETQKSYTFHQQLKPVDLKRSISDQNNLKRLPSLRYSQEKRNSYQFEKIEPKSISPITSPFSSFKNLHDSPNLEIISSPK